MSDEASHQKYICGIDLGTTNTTLASVAIEDDAQSISDLSIPQLTKPGTLLERSSLPSFIYLPHADEMADGAIALPWNQGIEFMVGDGARTRGAEVPLRLVSSAKSWLGHDGVDRRSPILPQHAPPDVPKVSPIEASTAYLQHIVEAWNSQNPDFKLEEQVVYLTVPASFDAAAKDLTIEAAARAGLTQVNLLEEPQAAFYAWLHRANESWRDTVKAGDRILVCDVGGGTTDFSLIEVIDQDGELTLERIAVGDHILLGGDNMDLTLAHHLLGKFTAEGKKLDANQQRSLVQAARQAKEKLLSNPELESEPIVVLGRGSKLIGGKLKTELTREEIEKILIDGFFPHCGLSDVPQQQPRAGFMQIGLPFASEPGVTRHLAQFLMRHQTAERGISHILLNGGVFNSEVLRQRLVGIVGGWFSNELSLIEDSDHNQAVARGAAYLGATKINGGMRIRAGTARSYYIGIETPMPSVPGVKPPINALCVVPFGMEEGSTAQVPGGELGLVVGQSVEFRFLSSSTRKEDVIGTMLDSYTWPDHLTEGSPIRMSLSADDLEAGSIVPVRLEVHV
ncbi:MAG: Hsp70 family protein, partial [Myxococcota bacterium]|nr:Hsp70 family protein [Myxococcota bacterium]